MKNLNLSKKNLITLFVLSSIIGILFVVFFSESMLGINYFIFATLFISIVFFFIKNQKDFNIKIFVLFSLLILTFSSIYFRRTYELLRIINFFLIPILICYTPYVSLNKLSNNIFSDIVTQLFSGLGLIDKYIRQGINILFTYFKINKSPKVKGFVIGIVICIALLAIILPLMSSADYVFNYFIGDFISILSNLNLLSGVSKTILAFIVASYFFGFICNIFKDNKTDNKDSIAGTDNNVNDPIIKYLTKEKNSNDFTVTEMVCKIVLTVLNLIYLLFSTVQFNYLFLNNIDNSSFDFTYAEYARSGFFEMLTLTIINFLIIMIIRYITSKDKDFKNKYIKISLSLITIANYIMIISAFYRMHLYESTYGFTRLRLLVYLFLILESILMLLVIYGVWNYEYKIIRRGIVIITIFYLFLNFINIDGYIAKKNIDRYYDTDKIDLNYLCHTLSDDALPELEQLIDDDDIMVRYKIKERFDKFYSYNWQEYNIAKSKANKLHEKYLVE